MTTLSSFVARELGDHVDLRPVLGRIDIDERCGRPVLRERHTVGEGRADDRDADDVRGHRACRRCRPSRAGVLPWLKMITASAPAASALIAFVGEGARSALDEGDVAGPLKSSPAKSAASQPLVLACGGSSARSTGDHVAGDLTEARAGERTRSRTSAAIGVSCCSAGGGVKMNGNSFELDVPAGRLERLDHVVDAVGVALGARGTSCRRSRRRWPGTPPGAHGRPRLGRTRAASRRCCWFSRSQPCCAGAAFATATGTSAAPSSPAIESARPSARFRFRWLMNMFVCPLVGSVRSSDRPPIVRRAQQYATERDLPNVPLDRTNRTSPPVTVAKKPPSSVTVITNQVRPQHSRGSAHRHRRARSGQDRLGLPSMVSERQSNTGDGRCSRDGRLTMEPPLPS